MNWVGNDIVDLSLADSNCWKRERYRFKLFSSFEQDIILNVPNPFRMLWLLWSMKESAYKIHLRHTRNRSFNPLRFACELTEEGKGRVEVDSYLFYTRSTISERFIHTVATPTNCEQIDVNFKVVMADEPAEVRCQLRHELKRVHAENCRLEVEDIMFQKTFDGLPSLKVKNQSGMGHPCSISHHGSFGAYAVAY